MSNKKAYINQATAFGMAVVSLLAWISYAGTGPLPRRWSPRSRLVQMLPPDSTNQDSLKNRKYKPSRRPTYTPEDRQGDRFSNRESSSPFLLGQPSNVKTEVQYIDSLKRYEITEKAGELDVRPPVYMTYKEYTRWQQLQASKSYWKSKSAGLDGESEVASKRVIPKIHIPGAFDRIFGGNYVDIRPNGNITLKFGARFNRIENPSIPIERQKTGDFQFEQAIALNLIGKVGDKLKITANWDTKANFDFENNLKLEYTGYDEEIIRKIEAGNVSLPLNSTLITGAQNLFGIKSQLQFGRLAVTTITSNQRGRNDNVQVNNGAQVRDFEIRADDYDDNRHFYLSDYFHDHYDETLSRLPLINTTVMIRRLEVYVTNTNSRSTEGLRNIVALADIAEPNPFRQQFDLNKGPEEPASNEQNRLYSQIRNTRNQNTIIGALNGKGMVQSEDYEVVNNARRLDPREYKFNERLGYISLNTTLQPQEVLAVSFEYTFKGKTYRVGELIDDYQTLDPQAMIFLKLLKATKPNLDRPTWDLMMKNVYSLNANQVSRDKFQLDLVYKDDESGVNLTTLREGQNFTTPFQRPLVDMFNLDNVNPNGDPPKDGNFDFIQGLTIDADNGRIYFPETEPFGSALKSKFIPGTEDPLVEKYVFQELYDKTKNEARQFSSQNKFFLVGRYQATLSDEIRLPGIRIAPGSVKVFAGSTRLTEGTDFRVDYNLGTVKILNPGYTASGENIRVDYEKADLLNLQPRTMLGARFDYKISNDLTFGGTVLKQHERTFLQRVSIGDEPTNNAIAGIDVNLQKESRFLTKMVDKLPLISTKAPSSVTFSGEYAQLFPGKSKLPAGAEDGTSYIDDFEGSRIPSLLSNQFGGSVWRLSSVPPTVRANNTALGKGDFRARIAWYTIDPSFYQPGDRPGNVTEADLRNHYVRPVQRREVFPNRAQQPQTSYDNTFDIAYYPTERGQYNFGPHVRGGQALNPDPNILPDYWGGISRQVAYDTDFENANVEYLEFWMMDPFIADAQGGSESNVGGVPANTNPGGKLIFNLGNLSEDVLPDTRFAFENGLPIDGNTQQVTDNTAWGRVPKVQNITDAFDNTDGAREKQDIGFDGLNNAEELTKYIPALPAAAGTDAAIAADPAGDDFKHFLDPVYDAGNPTLLDRYKLINGAEGNSGLNAQRSYTSLPDKEDLNQDNTVNTLEQYWEYTVPLTKADLEIGKGFITDKVVNEINGDQVAWYQFRIPIKDRGQSIPVGGIDNFRAMRFIRMYLTEWSQPVVLRFLQFQFVANQWRRYPNILSEGCRSVPVPEPSASFTVSTVNIEENSSSDGIKIPYVLPPGINRQQDNSTINQQLQNEQSLRLCVEELQDQYSEAVTKDVSMDMLIYKNLKLFLHGESNNELKPVADGEVNAFVRIGTDFTRHYYQISVPLKITLPGSTTAEAIWPAENTIDIAFQKLVDVKVERNAAGLPFNVPYSKQVGQYVITVFGNPDFSDVRSMMIGIQNPCNTPADEKSLCLWVDELRVTDFNKKAGWAATARGNVKLADLANVIATGSYTAVGFGGLQEKIAQRARANTAQFDLSANITADKFLPEKLGIKVPLSVGYGSTTVSPRYNPLDGDVELTTSVNNIRDSKARGEYREKVISRETRRNINLINVRKDKTDPQAKPHVYDVENLSFTYAYNDVLAHDPATARYFMKNYRGGVAYTYSSTPKAIQPLQKVSALSSPYLQLIKDLNFTPVPSTISIRTDLDRRYSERYRQRLDPITKEFFKDIPPSFEKSFFFNRIYDVKWSLTKSLTFDFTATNRSVIDEPNGKINKREDSLAFKNKVIWDNLKSGGRTTNYNQLAALTYRLPLDKLPLTNWLSADARYAAGYTWTASSLALNPSGVEEQDTTTVQLGNRIQNTAEKSINGRVDLVRLYDKVGFLRDINSPKRPAAGGAPARPGVKVPGAPKVPGTDNKKGSKGKEDPKADTKKESLKAEEEKLKAEGKAAGTDDSKGKNDKKSKKADKPGDEAAEDTTEQKPAELKALKGFLRVLMSVRTLNVGYTVTEGSQLPGYLPRTRFFGSEQFDSPINGANSLAPGVPFLLGKQYGLDNLFGLAQRNGWYVDEQSSGFLTTPLQGLRTEALTLRAAVEPFKTFNIQLDAKRNRTQSEEVFYRFSENFDTASNQGPGFQRQSPITTGNFSVSTIAVQTFFEAAPTSRQSAAFEQFIDNRQVIRQRLERANPNAGFYSANSQDVLVPSFLYAYQGRDVNGYEAKTTSPFKTLPLPNWRIDYNGLSNLEFVKKYFTSVNITHSYSSNYDVSSYTTSLNYSKDPGDFPNQMNNEGDFVPYFIIQQVALTERFSPLVGVNLKTKSKITIRAEYRKERNLALNLTNAQVTQTGVEDLTFGFGYTTNNFRVPFKIRGEYKILKNDLTARLDLSLRDNSTLLRRIEMDSTTNTEYSINTFTTGAKLLQIKPTVDYVVNKRLNLQFYFTRTVNSPKVSNSFRNSLTEGGIQLRYSLS